MQWDFSLFWRKAHISLKHSGVQLLGLWHWTNGLNGIVWQDLVWNEHLFILVVVYHLITAFNKHVGRSTAISWYVSRKCSDIDKLPACLRNCNNNQIYKRIIKEVWRQDAFREKKLSLCIISTLNYVIIQSKWNSLLLVYKYVVPLCDIKSSTVWDYKLSSFIFKWFGNIWSWAKCF